MVLMVFFSSRISPRTSTVILLRQVAVGHGRGDLGDVADLAVRLPAMEFTESVKILPHAAHALHFRLAAQLAFGSHLARHARHFDANALSWSTMVLMVFFSSRISPRTSTVILRDKSPLATAVVTSAMFRTWLVRLPPWN
jgi:hypothetical protein